ncbi:MAG: prepilin peptidase [Planctomycetota bacterium]|nr:MAG: prepilin peptidase [Planctomycetota bacterium]
MNRLFFDLPPFLALMAVFWIGACIGSFLNVCVHRFPRANSLWDQLRSISVKSSHCPRCLTDIRWYDNIPIFGWLSLHGRCRACGQSISLRYPAVELFNALLFVLVYWLEIPMAMGAPLEASSAFAELGPQTIPGLGTWSPLGFLHLRLACHLVLIEALLVATLIDWDLMIIPDGCTIPPTVFGVLMSTLFGIVHLVPVWHQDPRLLKDFRIAIPKSLHPWFLPDWSVPDWFQTSPHLHGLLVSLAGLAVGAVLVIAVRSIGSKVLRREAMGEGDIFLMAMVGAYLGWQATILAFFLAALLATTAQLLTLSFKLDKEIPYGPYLSLGSLVVLLGWRPIWGQFAERVFSLGPLLLPVTFVMLITFPLLLFMMQGIKWLLGIPLYPPELPGEWSAADQSLFFSGENSDRHQGNWKPETDWPGDSAGRGTSGLETWRNW